MSILYFATSQKGLELAADLSSQDDTIVVAASAVENLSTSSNVSVLQRSLITRGLNHPNSISMDEFVSLTQRCVKVITCP